MLKKYSLFLCLLPMMQTLSAQITLTTANNPEFGEEYIYNSNDGTTVDPGIEGENITWDFSNISTTSNSSSTVTEASNLPNGSLFPDATFGFLDPTTANESYYYASATAQGFYGIVSSFPITSSVIYTDPQDWLRYPMTYGDSYTDTFSGTIETTLIVNRGGTAEVTVDGYGTLITPAGTFNNVVRVYTQMDYEDELSGSVIATYDEVRYMWFDVESGVPLMLYSDLSSSLGTSVLSASYLEATPVSTSSPLAKEIDLSVFPNPTADLITIDYTLSENTLTTVSVTNLLGKEIILVSDEKQIAGTHQSSIDLSSFSNGTYFVKVIIDGRLATHKVLVQK